MAKSEALRDTVALVTGASRGVGRGIAIGLGEAGATVYVTGRSAEGAPTLDLGGTVEHTATSVDDAGGHGVPVRCDHRDDAAVAELFARIQQDQGRLDVLVNSVWAGYEVLHAGGHAEWVRPFWDQTTALWDPMFLSGVRAHYISAVLAARIMAPRRRGLIVNVSHVTADGLTVGDNVAYSLAKCTDNRMMLDMSKQLRPHGVTAIALYPGLVRTEGIMRWRDYMDLSNSESPVFAGRAVAALAADPDVLAQTGRVLRAADLARDYGFTDVDGHIPEPLQPTFQ
jgi:NAD(P)-dependent dehydrogenase (short-subunit alcohol dehydrogenase family)